MSRKLTDNKDFYRRVLQIGIPIVIQNGITNFVSLLDNIMVGQVGTTPMGGVAVVNQLIMIFNLCIFGTVSAAGIFTAQYYGAKDHDGIRHTFRFKVILGLLFSGLCIGAFLLFREPLIRLYLRGEGSAQDAADILAYGTRYLYIMLWGLIPFALSNAFSSTLRECGQATAPMIAGAVAVCVNLVLNYLLIFGHLGLPAMGVEGAALATVISRFVELAIVAVWTSRHSDRHPFIRGAFRSIRIPRSLLSAMARRGTPLICNEIIWAFGMAFMNQCYSTCSLDVMNALNISTAVMDVANIVVISLGNTVGILMGQYMGAGLSRKEIQESNNRLMVLALLCGVVFGLIQGGLSQLFPRLYNTTDSIRSLAARIILISAFVKPVGSFFYSAYFTIRSGGKTVITFLCDSGALWILSIPLAFCLTRFTDLPFIPIFIICQITDVVKATVTYILVKKGIWIQNITV